VLQQVGTPDEVYTWPANLFVAQFVGSPVMNVADIDVVANGKGAKVQLKDHAEGFAFPKELAARLDAAGAKAGRLALGIRPEGVLVSREKQKDFLPVEAHIIEPLGSHDIVDLKIGSQFLRARTRSGFVGRPGETVHVRIDPAQAHFFDRQSGNSLGIRL
jgi:multiple sugar transport system ATP-binding protein